MTWPAAAGLAGCIGAVEWLRLWLARCAALASPSPACTSEFIPELLLRLIRPVLGIGTAENLGYRQIRNFWLIAGFFGAPAVQKQNRGRAVEDRAPAMETRKK
jgi:hypothetical protein